ncbi:hypothetical protein MPTK1_4g05340 [Marchantia polymorpha subsp. ruderalis]|uniref:Uncharacterized protein n=2 Tax=Marchantia polymorpha TaxID=3197 RepID=A0AAF6B6L5_MARPO|nr:hypothetical protein MARPO_0087s0055 [Marchantia polymorpha]BBN07649.1 hypothetical protein Mp_4g05340 [Marchantia polymorpha subsp. ruderalis]|eukprot:PTQ33622.1 hypothetical protein MARPO_0087s0055 [Marchantia polymorpha]
MYPSNKDERESPTWDVLRGYRVEPPSKFWRRPSSQIALWWFVTTMELTPGTQIQSRKVKKIVSSNFILRFLNLRWAMFRFWCQTDKILGMN